MLKHIGKLSPSGEKVVVLFNEVPNEPENCLLVKSSELSDIDHDELMQAVESNEGQHARNLGDIANSRMNRAGRPLLQSLHTSGKILKMPTDSVFLTPNNKTEVLLKEVNDVIRGHAMAQGIQNPNVSENANSAPNALSDDQIAQSLVNQAKMMEKEAKELRSQAYELDPSLKRGRKSAKKSEAASDK